MVDVAELVMRGRAEGFDEANSKLRTTQGEAAKTEGAVESMGRAVARVDPHMQNMNRAMMASQRQMRATQQAGLGLTRQFSDIGVSIAGGMPIWMVAIQQGSQLQDQFALMRMEGVSMAGAMRGMAASFAPLLGIVGRLGAVLLPLTLTWAVFERQVQKSISDDVTKGLGLTADQLDKVKDRSVTMGDVFVASISVIGKHIMDGPIGDGVDWLVAKWNHGLDVTAKATAGEVATIVAFFVAAFDAIVAAWKNFPAVFSDLVITGANLALAGLEWLINKGIDGLNKLLQAAKVVAAVNPALGFVRGISELNHVDFEPLKNNAAGAAADVGDVFVESFGRVRTETLATLNAMLKEIQDAAVARAVKRALDQAGDASAGRQGGKTDLEKRIEDTLRYIQALKDEAATLGMSAIAAKEYEIAQRALKAPTEALREEVEKYGDALLVKMRIEAADMKSKGEQLEMLRAELRLVGEGNLMRAVELAQLAERQRLVRAGVDPKSAIGQGAIERAGEVARGQEAVAEATFKANDALTYQLDLLTLMDDRARDAAAGMTEAFGEVGRALGEVLALTTNYARREEDIYVRRQAMLRDAGTDYEAIGRIVARSNEESRAAQVAYYGDVLSASKQFFGEQTGAFKALQAVEMAYRTVQFAMAAKSVAMGAWEAAQNIPKYIAQATAAATAGAAKMFAQLGPFGFAAVAAMGVVLAAFGLRSLGGGGGSAPAALPTTNTGTGTVLGSPDEQSQSIGNSLELAERYYDRDLQLSNRMVDSLKAIESGIGDLTASIGQQLGIGGAFDTSGLGLGSTTSSSLFGLISKTRTAELADQGISLDSGRLADLLANGIEGATYQVIQRTKTSSGFFGIGGGTTTWNEERSGNLTGSIERDLTALLGSLRNGILTAAGTLGIEGAAAVLDSFEVNLGRISFADMDADEISATLSAVFSALGDDMARAVLPNVRRYQEAGEGLMETLVRVATTYTQVDVVLGSLGMTFEKVGSTSISARMRLVDLAGGLENFTEQAAFFADNFLTETQRIAPVQAMVSAELARLGIATDISREEFAKLVTGLDTSRSGGAQLYTALMNLAPALDQVLTYSEELAEAERERAAALAEQRRSLDIALMEATGNTAGALAARRADELAAMDATLRALQQQVWAAQDAAAAQAELAQAQEQAADAARRLAEQRRGLEIQLMEALGRSSEALAAQRTMELQALDPSLRALQRQVWAAQDAAAANLALAEAQAEAAETAREAAERLSGLRERLLSAQGNDAALLALQRQEEMAEATSKAERSLLRQIYAAEDAAKANEALAEAQEKAAAAADALAQKEAAEDARDAALRMRLLQAQGNDAAILAAQREAEYAEATNRFEKRLLREIWAAEDAAAHQAKAMEAVEAARSALTTSYEREAAALQETIDKFADFSDSLRAFRDDLTQQATGGTSYAAAQAEFDRVARLARLGNEEGLSGLQGAGQNYIDAALANASTALEYRRAIGQVVGAVDAAIGTSDRNKSNAERQLEALDKSVSGLIQIDESVLSVRDAIRDLELAMRGMPVQATLAASADAPAALTVVQDPATAQADSEAADEIRELRAEIAGLRSALEKVAANTAAGAKSAARMDNMLTRVTRDGDAMRVEAA